MLNPPRFVSCPIQSSLSPLVSASFFGKVNLRFSGNGTCKLVQGWARDSLSKCHLSDGKVPLPHHSQREPQQALREFAHSPLLPCAYSTG